MKENKFRLEVAGIKKEVTLQVEYKRLMFYGGAKSSSHNNTFSNAANSVNKDYSTKAEVIKVNKGGQSIVDKINSETENTIQSIDFFTHGNEKQLLFKPDSDGNYQELYLDDDDEQKEGELEFWDYILGADSDENENGADIGEIDCKVFTKTAKIEIHGCNTGSITDENKGINFASTFSKNLYNAGKTKSVVVGHVTYANPNAHTTLSGSDYRHGGRRIYHNGKELFFTRKEGRITGADINKYLK